LKVDEAELSALRTPEGQRDAERHRVYLLAMGRGWVAPDQRTGLAGAALQKHNDATAWLLAELRRRDLITEADVKPPPPARMSRADQIKSICAIARIDPAAYLADATLTPDDVRREITNARARRDEATLISGLRPGSLDGGPVANAWSMIARRADQGGGDA